MLRLIYETVRDFLFSPEYARASLRSALTFVGTSAGTVVASASDATGAVNIEIIHAWDWKAWALRLGIAAILAGAVRLRAGDKNKTTAELVEELRTHGVQVQPPPAQP